MCSEIFRRITDNGSMRTRSPGWKEMAGAAGAVRAGAAAVRPPGLAMKSRMSFFVTRPEIPVPVSEAMSTLFSCAIRRTSGEERVRIRSSREAAPVGGDPVREGEGRYGEDARVGAAEEAAPAEGGGDEAARESGGAEAAGR